MSHRENLIVVGALAEQIDRDDRPRFEAEASCRREAALL